MSLLQRDPAVPSEYSVSQDPRKAHFTSMFSMAITVNVSVLRTSRTRLLLSPFQVTSTDRVDEPTQDD